MYHKFLVIKFTRALLTIICVTSIVGCAGQKDARKVAALTAESINELKKGSINFLEEADELAKKNELRIQQIDQRTLANRLQVSVFNSA